MGGDKFNDNCTGTSLKLNGMSFQFFNSPKHVRSGVSTAPGKVLRAGDDEDEDGEVVLKAFKGVPVTTDIPKILTRCSA